MVDGAPGSRPIDNLLANLNELYRQLVLAAGNPAQAKQALEQVDVQVASLRANVTRLPQPLAGMIDKVAKDAAGDATASSIAQISDDMAQNVTGPCQQIVANRYPFSKSDRDVPMADFAKTFRAGRVDRQILLRQSRAARQPQRQDLGLETQSEFHRAGFRTPRCASSSRRPKSATRSFRPAATSPNVSLEVKPLTLSSDAQTATLSINGANVVAQQGTPFAATTVQWPGAGAGEASIVMAPDMPDRKSSLERTGAWALFRLIDAGSSIQSGNALKVSFVVFGREVSYQLTSSSLVNPLSMPALRQFKCPNGL